MGPKGPSSTVGDHAPLVSLFILRRGGAQDFFSVENYPLRFSGLHPSPFTIHLLSFFHLHSLLLSPNLVIPLHHCTPQPLAVLIHFSHSHNKQNYNPSITKTISSSHLSVFFNPLFTLPLLYFPSLSITLTLSVTLTFIHTNSFAYTYASASMATPSSSSTPDKGKGTIKRSKHFDIKHIVKRNSKNNRPHCCSSNTIIHCPWRLSRPEIRLGSGNSKAVSQVYWRRLFSNTQIVCKTPSLGGKRIPKHWLSPPRSLGVSSRLYGFELRGSSLQPAPTVLTVAQTLSSIVDSINSYISVMDPNKSGPNDGEVYLRQRKLVTYFMQIC